MYLISLSLPISQTFWKSFQKYINVNKSISLSATIQKTDFWLKHKMHWVTHENQNSSEYLKWQKPSLEKGCFMFASVLRLASVPWLKQMNKDLKLILQPPRGNKGSGISVLGNPLVFIYSTVKGHVVLEPDFSLNLWQESQAFLLYSNSYVWASLNDANSWGHMKWKGIKRKHWACCRKCTQHGTSKALTLLWKHC